MAMDARYVNAFLRSVRSVLAMMAGTEIEIGRPFLRPVGQRPDADVSAVVGFSGQVVGCMVLSFPMPTALALASRFAGAKMTAGHPDFADAMGELANMVAGHAKAQWDQVEASISLPSVIVGAGHVISQSRQYPRLVLPCKGEVGEFHLEIAIKLTVDAQTA